MTVNLEILDIVGKAAGILQTDDDGVRRILGALYGLYPDQVPDSWEIVENSLQQAGASFDKVGAFTAFLKTITDEHTVGEHPRAVLDDVVMRAAFQLPEVDDAFAEQTAEAEEAETAEAAEEIDEPAVEAAEPVRQYVATGSLIFYVDGRYFRGEGHEVWRAGDEFGVYFHDRVQNYDSQGNVLLDEEDDEEESEEPAAPGAAPDYDALCAQVVLHYAIPVLASLVSSKADLAVSRTQQELVASLCSVLAHQLCGWNVPEQADELVAELMRELERQVQVNPEPAARFHAAFGASGPDSAGQWLDYRLDEDSARIDEVLAALPRRPAEPETTAASDQDGEGLDEPLLRLDPYDRLLAGVLDKVPQAAGMAPPELHALVAATLSE